MLSLIVEVPKPVITLAGIVRYLSYPQITDKWFPLSGGWLPALENPVIFGLIGFKYGQTSINDVVQMKMPTFNATPSSPTSVYPRPLNKNNSLGRNLSKSVGMVVESSLKAHTHPGSTSSDGSHTHSRSNGGRFSAPNYYTAHPGHGQYPASWNVNTVSAGHGTHSHSGGISGSMVLDAAHTSSEVEPKGYGAILCIHKG